METPCLPLKRSPAIKDTRSSNCNTITKVRLANLAGLAIPFPIYSTVPQKTYRRNNLNTYGKYLFRVARFQ